MVEEKIVIQGEFKGSRPNFRKERLELKKKENKNYFVKFYKKLKKVRQ